MHASYSTSSSSPSSSSDVEFPLSSEELEEMTESKFASRPSRASGLGRGKGGHSSKEEDVVQGRKSHLGSISARWSARLSIPEPCSPSVSDRESWGGAGDSEDTQADR